jgi:hypothetical protein
MLLQGFLRILSFLDDLRTPFHLVHPPRLRRAGRLPLQLPRASHPTKISPETFVVFALSSVLP